MATTQNIFETVRRQYLDLATGFPKRVTVGTESKSFEDLEIEIPDDTQRILLVPESTSIALRCESEGDASATSAQIPVGGLDFPISALRAASLAFYASESLAVAVFVFVPRTA